MNPCVRVCKGAPCWFCFWGAGLRRSVMWPLISRRQETRFVADITQHIYHPALLGVSSTSWSRLPSLQQSWEFDASIAEWFRSGSVAPHGPHKPQRVRCQSDHHRSKNLLAPWGEPHMSYGVFFWVSTMMIRAHNGWWSTMLKNVLSWFGIAKHS